MNKTQIKVNKKSKEQGNNTKSKTDVKVQDNTAWYSKAYKKTKDFFFTKKKEDENILGFIFRQVQLPDSSGNRSLTVTLMVAVSVLFTFFFIYETRVALSYGMIKNIETGAVTYSMKGYSENFEYIMLMLVGIIITFFNNREIRRKGETGTMQKFFEMLSSKLTK